MKVRRAIQEAATLLEESGRETGFEVCRWKGVYLIMGPIIGGCEELGFDFPLPSAENFDEEAELILCFHFHLEEVGAIQPSAKDLLASMTAKLSGVGQLNSRKGEIKILSNSFRY
ncbi:hypothetical protein H5T58_02550 [Candidatus Parcubacteria bacterium]|nr:hypothetical protein [Candidatus Parcubacteria bacterium]